MNILYGFCIACFLFSCCDNKQEGKINQAVTYGHTNLQKDSIIRLFANYLNNYIDNGLFKYNYEKNRCIGFGIIDLLDTLNNSNNAKFEIANNHIYVFGPLRKRFGYTNIAIIENNTVVFFKAVNCPSIGSSAEEVKKYVETNFPNEFRQRELIDRIGRCSEHSKKSIMRQLATDDEDLIYDTFECK